MVKVVFNEGYYILLSIKLSLKLVGVGLKVGRLVAADSRELLRDVLRGVCVGFFALALSLLVVGSHGLAVDGLVVVAVDRGVEIAACADGSGGG